MIDRETGKGITDLFRLGIGAIIILAMLIVSAIIVLLVQWISGGLTTSEIDILKEQAIERGYALYCPVNGEFAWKGECE